MAQLLPSQRPTITVSGRVFTDLTNLKVLYTNVTNAAARGNFRASGQSSGYQVTSGKTLKITATRIINQGTAGELLLAYSDNDVGLRSSTAWTNPVYIWGASTNSFIYSFFSASAYVQEFTLLFDVASQKYPGIQSNGADATAIVYGYEV